MDVPGPDGADERHGGSGVRRPRGDSARARGAERALAAHRAHRRLARLRPDLRRGGAHPTEGPHADPGRVLRVRRGAEPARLRDEPDVLTDAPAPHRPRPRAARPDRGGLAREDRGRRPPPLRVLRRPRLEAPVVQPAAKDGLTWRSRTARRPPRSRPGRTTGPTTRSSSVAATTGSRTPPTSRKAASA